MSSVGNDTVGAVPLNRSEKAIGFSASTCILSSAQDERSTDLGGRIEDERKPLLPSTAQPGGDGARGSAAASAAAVEKAAGTRERLWPTIVSTLVASISALLLGYTYGFPSSALLDLTGDVEELPENYQLNTLLSDLFAVRP